MVVGGGGRQGACDEPQTRRRSFFQTFDAAQTLTNDRIGVTGVRGEPREVRLLPIYGEKSEGWGGADSPPRAQAQVPRSLDALLTSQRCG